MQYDLGETLLGPTSSFLLTLPAHLKFSFLTAISSVGFSQ